MNGTNAVEKAPPKALRMTLAGVTHGKQNRPLRVLLYGVEGIGKSTWAAATDRPIFFCAEDGAARLDVARFPEPSGWPDVMEAIETLTEEEHDYDTFVVDTLDALEAMLWRFVCDRDKQKSIEGYGYGKGYNVALVEWRRFMAALEAMQRKRKMGVVLVAHSLVKTFKNPEGDDYDRYQLKLYDKHAAALREWAEDVLFARYETFAVKEEGARIAKGVSSGARVVHTQRTAAWDAKNRHDLPEFLPLNYDDFAAAVAAHRPKDATKLLDGIEQKIAQLGDDAIAGKVRAAVKKAGNDAAELAKVNDRLDALVAQKGAQ